VQLVSDAVIRARAGIKDPKRPIGSFIFLGPTGVGKTELAKALAESLFDSEANMIRIDMSEYMEKHTVSKLIGAPPGYIGYDEGGFLTEAVRRKPFSVLLFDEIEKAHPDVFNIMLQILDDGRCTDSQGRTVNFKNTVVIMTSNIGSQTILSALDSDPSGDGDLSDNVKSDVTRQLRANFRPEFLNRVDETIIFKPLTTREIIKIVDLLICEVNQRLSDRSITLNVSEKAKIFIAESAYDASYGARPLRRFIQRELETVLARRIISGEIFENSTVFVDFADDQIVITSSSVKQNDQKDHDLQIH
jgi:ATP-dependent Clp protease ATP-binding subunit ClpB